MTKTYKIDVLVPWTPMDGIKEYWLGIECYLNKYIKTHIVKNDKPDSLNPFYFLRLAEQSKTSDLVHIQHNYCLFGSLFHKFNSIWAWLYYLRLKLSNNLKIVTTIHDVVEPRNLNFYKQIYLDFMNLPLKLFSNKIITHNKHTKNQLIRQGFGGESIAVIPNGVENIEITNSKKDIMNKFKIPDKKTIVLFGWIRADKQYEKIIYALKDLPEFQLIVIGGARDEDYEYLSFLKNEIKRLKLGERVIFTGVVDEKEKFDLISCGDVAVFPYRRISNSAALMDAISVHVPCITSNIPEFKELEDEWHMIKTIDVSSNQNLVDAIITTVKNKETMKMKIKNYIKHNNRDIVAQKTKKIYEEVLS